MKNIIIKVGNDLELRSWQIKWAPMIFRLVDKNRGRLRPWMPWIPKTKKETDSKAFIKNCLKEQKEGKSLEMGIWYQNKLVGCLGIHGLSKNNRRGSLGYWLDTDHQGKGIITRSIQALIKYGFEKLNLNRIGIETATKNSKSLAVAKRLGFVKEGVIREYEFVDNQFLDYVVLSLLKKEWKK